MTAEDRAEPALCGPLLLEQEAVANRYQPSQQVPRWIEGKAEPGGGAHAIVLECFSYPANSLWIHCRVGVDGHDKFAMTETEHGILRPPLANVPLEKPGIPVDPIPISFDHVT